MTSSGTEFGLGRLAVALSTGDGCGPLADQVLGRLVGCSDRHIGIALGQVQFLIGEDDVTPDTVALPIGIGVARARSCRTRRDETAALFRPTCLQRVASRQRLLRPLPPLFASDHLEELMARVDFVMRQAGCLRVRLHKEGILHEATDHLCHPFNIAYKKLLPGSILAAFLPA